jgi:hypothetical protein
LSLYDRLSRLESSTADLGAIRVHLDAIDRELARAEAKILRVAQRRSHWTRADVTLQYEFAEDDDA